MRTRMRAGATLSKRSGTHPAKKLKRELERACACERERAGEGHPENERECERGREPETERMPEPGRESESEPMPAGAQSRVREVAYARGCLSR